MIYAEELVTQRQKFVV